MTMTDLPMNSRFSLIFRARRLVRVSLVCACVLVSFAIHQAFGSSMMPTGERDEVLRLGEEFGLVVGEVDEETRDFLGLQRAEGVVVYEVIAGRPAELAGIKPKALIKEIDKHEIRTLADFGHALKAALATENFTVATYQPFIPGEEVSAGINFHFVRILKD